MPFLYVQDCPVFKVDAEEEGPQIIWSDKT